VITLDKNTDGDVTFRSFFQPLDDWHAMNRVTEAVACGDEVHNGESRDIALANARYRIDPIHKNDLKALAYVFSLGIG
jgi:hypothetical protein